MENKSRNGKNISESPIFKGILGKAEDYLKKPIRVKELLNDAYKKASEKKDFGTIAHEVWENLQVLSRMIKAAVSGDYHGIPTSTIIGGIAVFIYFLTPIDFVPDFIPVIGLLDDVSLMAWFMTSIKTEMEHFLEWESGNHVNQAAPQNTDQAFNTPKYDQTPAGTYASNSERTALSQSRPEHTSSNAHKATSGHHPNMQGSAGHASAKHAEEVLHFPDHTVEGLGHSDENIPRATSSGSGEPNARASTTDSTRVPSTNRNDTDTGGNVR